MSGYPQGPGYSYPQDNYSQQNGGYSPQNGGYGQSYDNGYVAHDRGQGDITTATQSWSPRPTGYPPDQNVYAVNSPAEPEAGCCSGCVIF